MKEPSEGYGEKNQKNKIREIESERKNKNRRKKMTWELDADRPIYAQLVERLQTQIILGKYQPGERLPSVRELAAAAAVNPNTMQR